MDYTDVVIEATDVTPASETQRLSFEVRVLSSPAGEQASYEALTFSFEVRELQDAIGRLEARELSEEELRAFGTRLADWLLPPGQEGAPGVRELYEASLRHARDRHDGGVRLRLRLPPRLAWIPWEYLYLPDPTPGHEMFGFLALNPRVAVLRHELMALDTPLIEAPDTDLKVVAAFAQADGTVPLDLDKERQLLSAIFAEYKVQPEFLEQASITGILENIPSASIFHFAGHGTFDTRGVRPRTFQASNRLLMGDAAIGPQQLSLNLRGNSVRLAVIATCLGAKRGGPNVINLWESIARTLIVCGVPAVVANQFTIEDRAAIAFSTAFYKALLGGLSVERAVVAGRLAIYNAHKQHPGEDRSGRDWGAPVLYMRAPHGRLLAGSADPASRQRARDDVLALFGEIRQIIGTARDERPLKPPRLPKSYVERPAPEGRLSALLTAPADDPLTVVLGGEGVGKGVVVTAVANKLYDQGVFGGVLWADCADRTVQDVLREFAGRLGLADHGQALGGRHGGLGTQIWDELNRRAQAGPPTLVVVDNVNDTEATAQLLPQVATPCRLVVISDTSARPRGLDEGKILRVGPLEPAESAALFTRILGEDATFARDLAGQRDDLIAIGERYNHLVSFVNSVAKSMLEDGVAPPVLLRQLERRERQGDGTAALLAQHQEIVLQGLSETQRAIFGLFKVLGKGNLGDLGPALLASVALCTPDVVQDALKAFLSRELLKAGTNGGYSLQPSYLGLAERIFAQRTPYEQRAAIAMFVRACLERVQWYAESLSDSRGRADLTDEAAQDQHLSHVGRTIAEKMLPQIRGALEQAGRTLIGVDLIRRFITHAMLARFNHLIVDTGVVFLDLRMAALERVALGTCPPFARTIYDGWGYDYEGLIGLVSEQTRLIWPETTEAEARLAPYMHPFNPDLLEAHLTLSASRLSGSLANTDLVGANWMGVAAPLLALRAMRMVGARLIACDFGLSTWRSCNASRADLSGSDLRDVILHDVILRDATLRDVDLSGAVLERVDLSGADLTGANFSNARLRDVRLVKATLDNVTWAGATFEGPILASLGRQGEEVRRECEKPAPTLTPVFAWASPRRDLTNDEAAQLLRDAPEGGLGDLRATTLDTLKVAGMVTGGLDLSATTVEHLGIADSELSGVYLTAGIVNSLHIQASCLFNFDMHAAQVTNGLLVDAELVEPQGYAATLERSLILNSKLCGANLFGASLIGTSISISDLTGSNFASSHWQMCDLDDCSLADANLLGARIEHSAFRRGTDLRNADLRSAYLHRVDLREAILEGANLDQARLVAVDLTGANIDEAQLRQAARLAGSCLPDGTLYTGQWELSGDLEAARQAGVPADDKAALESFYRKAQEDRVLYAATRGSEEDALPSLRVMRQLIAKLAEDWRPQADVVYAIATNLARERATAPLETLETRCAELRRAAAGNPLLAPLAGEVIANTQQHITVLWLRRLMAQQGEGAQAAALLGALADEIEATDYPCDAALIEGLRKLDRIYRPLARAFAEHLCDQAMAHTQIVMLYAGVHVAMIRYHKRRQAITLLRHLLESDDETLTRAVEKTDVPVRQELLSALAALPLSRHTRTAQGRLKTIMERLALAPAA